MTDAIAAIRAKLLPRFVTVAQERLVRVRAMVTTADGAARLARDDLHALAGEAAMLGEVAVAELARAAEIDARAWCDGEPAARERCASRLDVLTARLDELAGSR